MDSATKFDGVVQWLHDSIIVSKQAPGFIVGLSGTDSIVAFLAAYKAFEQAGKPERVMGVHFAPSQDFLLDYPVAEVHTWFSKHVIPWLRKQCPKATIVVDTSIDWRYDGLRWGTLADMSVIAMPYRRMRYSEDKYWVVGTRNRTEDVLYNYSVASTVATVQPIIKLWKSEIMDICEYLQVPRLVIEKSCEADCICGREQLRAEHGRELDTLLADPTANVEPELKKMLINYINERIRKGSFKLHIPYEP